MSEDPAAVSTGLRGRMSRLLTRFGRTWFPMTLVLFGVSLVLVGYLYDLTSVGAPPPEDAPLDLKLMHDRSRVFAERINMAGVSAFAVGLVLLVAQLVVRFFLPGDGRAQEISPSDVNVKGP